MKIRNIIMAMSIAAAALCSAAQDNPMANPEAIVTSGNVRFTVLTPQLIRIEQSPSQQFEDRATFAVVNRNLPVPAFTAQESDGYLCITTSDLTLKYKVGSEIKATDNNPDNLSIALSVNGREELWYPGKPDNANLKGTRRTLDNNLDDNVRNELEDGVISLSGWALVDESPSARRGDTSVSFPMEQTDGQIMPWVTAHSDKKNLDWYFFGYGHDYKQAVSDFTRIGGKIPLPPDYIFGYWYSRYWAYTDAEFRELVKEIEENDIPIDVMIMDMDWHKAGWTGWTWNKNLIPDPKGLVKFFHDHDLQVALNLHPADGFGSHEDIYPQMANAMGINPSTGTAVPWTLDRYDFYQAFAENFLRKQENENGIDFWWIDWQQWMTNRNIEGLGETFWINHVFFNDQKINRKTRPVIFHRWGGLGSHRYQIGFSGDTHTTFSTLAFQPWFTSTASNVGYGYWGHDLGGHQQYFGNDPELYLRWLQFGIFTPIFRSHATNFDEIERRIWKYDNFPLLLQTVKMRQMLFPYIYTAARETYDTGISMCRPMYYEYPEASEAYSYKDQYFFGNDFLVSPVLTAAEGSGLASKTTWIPEGKWWDVCRSQLVEGDCVITDYYDQEEIPLFMRAGAIVVMNPDQKNVKIRPTTLTVNAYPGANGSMSLYEDEGNTSDYENGAFTQTHISQNFDQSNTTLTISPRTGAFAGMPEKRGYDVKFFGMTKPLSASINGVKLAQSEWSFNSATGIVEVNVPATPCSQAISVTIESDPAAIVPTKTSPSIEYVDGNIVAQLPANYKSATLYVTDPCGSECDPISTGSDSSIKLDIASGQPGAYKCSLYVDNKMLQKIIIK